MQYLLLAMEGAGDFAARTDPERAGDYWSAWSVYIAALEASGVLRGAGGLESPDVASTVRIIDGGRVVQDGPFADSKEHLGGYFVIEVDDLDHALDWAAKCPSAGYACVEVRPILASGAP